MADVFLARWLYAQARPLPTSRAYLRYIAMDTVALARFAVLEDRGVLALDGDEAHEFLQNLVTNDIDPVLRSAAVYTALLTPQGKYLCDFFVVAKERRLLLDCPVARKDDLLKRLTMYKLRAKIGISDESEALSVAAVFGDGVRDRLGLVDDAVGCRDIDDGIVYIDPRTADAGVRVIAGDVIDALSRKGFAEGTAADYDRHRLKFALPDSVRDLIVDKTVALEANLDFLNGVDFSKGCFVGQEVTARTKYRGLARKRLMSIRFEGDTLPEGEEIIAGGVSVGETRSSRDGYGLALIRLDRLEQAVKDGSTPTVDGTTVAVTKPDWLTLDDSDAN
jgi:folate-binding protein YgfZ